MLATTGSSDAYLNGTLSSSVGFGLILSLLAAIAIAVGGYLKRRDGEPAGPPHRPPES